MIGLDSFKSGFYSEKIDTIENTVNDYAQLLSCDSVPFEELEESREYAGELLSGMMKESGLLESEESFISIEQEFFEDSLLNREKLDQFQKNIALHYALNDIKWTFYGTTSGLSALSQEKMAEENTTLESMLPVELKKDAAKRQKTPLIAQPSDTDRIYIYPDGRVSKEPEKTSILSSAAPLETNSHLWHSAYDPALKVDKTHLQSGFNSKGVWEAYHTQNDFPGTLEKSSRLEVSYMFDSSSGMFILLDPWNILLEGFDEEYYSRTGELYRARSFNKEETINQIKEMLEKSGISSIGTLVLKDTSGPIIDYYKETFKELITESTLFYDNRHEETALMLEEAEEKIAQNRANKKIKETITAALSGDIAAESKENLQKDLLEEKVRDLNIFTNKADFELLLESPEGAVFFDLEESSSPSFSIYEVNSSFEDVPDDKIQLLSNAVVHIIKNYETIYKDFDIEKHELLTLAAKIAGHLTEKSPSASGTTGAPPKSISEKSGESERDILQHTEAESITQPEGDFVHLSGRTITSEKEAVELIKEFSEGTGRDDLIFAHYPFPEDDDKREPELFMSNLEKVLQNIPLPEEQKQTISKRLKEYDIPPGKRVPFLKALGQGLTNHRLLTGSTGLQADELAEEIYTIVVREKTSPLLSGKKITVESSLSEVVARAALTSPLQKKIFSAKDGLINAEDVDEIKKRIIPSPAQSPGQETDFFEEKEKTVTTALSGDIVAETKDNLQKYLQVEKARDLNIFTNPADFEMLLESPEGAVFFDQEKSSSPSLSIYEVNSSFKDVPEDNKQQLSNAVVHIIKNYETLYKDFNIEKDELLTCAAQLVARAALTSPLQRKIFSGKNDLINAEDVDEIKKRIIPSPAQSPGQVTDFFDEKERTVTTALSGDIVAETKDNLQKYLQVEKAGDLNIFTNPADFEMLLESPEGAVFFNQEKSSSPLLSIYEVNSSFEDVPEDNKQQLSNAVVHIIKNYETLYKDFNIEKDELLTCAAQLVARETESSDLLLTHSPSPEEDGNVLREKNSPLPAGRKITIERPLPEVVARAALTSPLQKKEYLVNEDRIQRNPLYGSLNLLHENHLELFTRSIFSGQGDWISADDVEEIKKIVKKAPVPLDKAEVFTSRVIDIICRGKKSKLKPEELKSRLHLYIEKETTEQLRTTEQTRKMSAEPVKQAGEKKIPLPSPVQPPRRETNFFDEKERTRFLEENPASIGADEMALLIDAYYTREKEISPARRVPLNFRENKKARIDRQVNFQAVQYKVVKRGEEQSVIPLYPQYLQTSPATLPGRIEHKPFEEIIKSPGERENAAESTLEAEGETEIDMELKKEQVQFQKEIIEVPADLAYTFPYADLIKKKKNRTVKSSGQTGEKRTGTNLPGDRQPESEAERMERISRNYYQDKQVLARSQVEKPDNTESMAANTVSKKNTVITAEEVIDAVKKEVYDQLFQ